MRYRCRAISVVWEHYMTLTFDLSPP